jgi:antitoxin (DNA-binding transcriptional repressor) of toxin-antitoxin stability system
MKLGISEPRAGLSRWPNRVCALEELIVTDRGRSPI